MSGHTPGPLVAARESEYCTYIETKIGRVLGAARGDWGDTLEMHAEIEANAKLWAASPDLLKALKNALSALVVLDLRVSGRPHPFIDDARAAIEKAEGSR